MGIFDRMGKVISSNINSLLDSAEDDEKIVNLNVDEMGEQLKEGRKDVIGAVAAEKQLAKRVEDLKAETAKWEKRAELALKTGDEALARDALKQKKRTTAETESAERARIEQRDAALRMKTELTRMEQKLEDIKLRKGTIASRARQAKGGGELGAKGGSSAFENFKRMEDKIEGKEAQNAAMNEVEEAIGGGEKERDLEAKFRDLERQTTGGGGAGSEAPSDIDDELAAMKKRLRV
jgi:phage shock protein A